jgi:hypothetical protein
MGPMRLRRVEPCLDVDNMLFFVLYTSSFPPLGDCHLVNIQSSHALGNDLLAIVEVIIGDLKVTLGALVLWGLLILPKEVPHLTLALSLILHELVLEIRCLCVHLGLGRSLDLVMLKGILVHLTWVLGSRVLLVLSIHLTLSFHLFW